MGPPALPSQTGPDSEICSKTEETPYIHQAPITTNCPQNPGPSETSGFPFSKRKQHLLLVSLGYQLKTLTHWSISWSRDATGDQSLPTYGLQGKGQNPNSWRSAMRQGRVIKFRITSHHSPHYLEFLKVPNFHRPSSIFHDQTTPIMLIMKTLA